ncbi:Bromodomain-containing protein [Gonapodya prolifera JEL478]|uniref:Bromodomain-containing protein n=1 Tax=Gonapodya prolifera (strain JEL478) TaxID=1344416 RepID=A0A139AYG1_GONPJ|nr:Bromodomain-containing protein [Gonapodya prolifera JEL478]|eukprot:KXS21603.1 Bromodomain-containing protein [Gonapodya prolifera JEL478]
MKRTRSNVEVPDPESSIPRSKRPRLSDEEGDDDGSKTDQPNSQPPSAEVETLADDGSSRETHLDTEQSSPRKPPLTLHLTLNATKHEKDVKMEQSVQETADVSEQCRQLLNAVKEYKDADGRQVCHIFKDLPDKRQYRDYYEIIAEPLAIKTIQRKVTEGRYGTLDELKADMDLMFKNAKQYNAPKSQVFQDAVTLQNVFRKELGAIKGRPISTRRSAARDGSVSASSLAAPLTPDPELDDIEPDPELKDKCRRLLAAMKDVKDADGNNLTSIFRELPSKQLYPDYYDKIERPMAIRIMQRKISDEKYSNLEEFRDDVELMFKNAKTYNHPKSQVYLNAVILLKRFREEFAAVASGEATASSRRPGNESGEASDIFGAADIREQCQTLIQGIEEYKDGNGRILAAVFLELPSRIDYPDYYVIINEPISLYEIKRNIESGLYHTLELLKKDVDLMFRNAKTYNAAKSQIYEDANQLQKFFRDEFTAVKHSLETLSATARGDRLDSQSLPSLSVSVSRKSKDRSRVMSEDRKDDQDEYVPAVTKIKVKKKFEPQMLLDAIQRDDDKSLRKLMSDYNVDPNALHPVVLFEGNFTWSPLHAAAFYGAEQCTQMLLDMGANVELADTWYGSRPLGWAAFGGHVEIARILVTEFGADRSAVNASGQRAIDIAPDPANPRWIGVLTTEEPSRAKSRSRAPAVVDVTDDETESENDEIVKPRLKITVRKSKEEEEDKADAKGRRKDIMVKDDDEYISVDDEVPVVPVGEEEGATSASKPRTKSGKRKPLWPVSGTLPGGGPNGNSGGIPGVPGKVDKPVNPVFYERASTAHILSFIVMTPSAMSNPRASGFCFEQAIPSPESATGTAVSVPVDVDRLSIMVYFQDVAPAPARIFGPGGSIKTSSTEVFPTVRRYLVVRWNGSILDLQPFFGEREDGGSGFIARPKMRNGLNTLEIFARERRKREREDEQKKGKEREREREEDEDGAPKRRGRKPKEDDVYEHSFRYFVTRS